MNEEGTANASVDDERMASEDEVVDDGEQLKGSAVSQDQYHPSLSSEVHCVVWNLCLGILEFA